ncbi:MAG: RNase adapter RapZ [Pseudomonadota bacterium]
MAEVSAAPAQARAPSVVLVTGLSGAGRTTAINTLEDLGFEAINNFPLPLVDALLADGRGGSHEGGELPTDRPLALGLETRTRGFSTAGLTALLARLRAQPEVAGAVLVFLDCEDATLARRFSETRRRHPLAPAEDVETGIARERDLLAEIRAEADMVIDTGLLTPHDLKAEMAARFTGMARHGRPHGTPARSPTVTISSFSYKRGVPGGADVVLDCRFLRNPYWDESLRSLDGRDAAVQDYVSVDPHFGAFFERVAGLLELLLPAYAEEGKVYFSVAFGCTGGRHRSVTVAERMKQRLADAGWPAALRHRELDRADPSISNRHASGVPGSISSGDERA